MLLLVDVEGECVSEKTSKGQKTRERIEGVAWDLFAEKGFEKTTMREIAKEAGVSLGAAYHYFRSKDEMVMALYRRTQMTISADVADVCAEHLRLEDRLCAFLEHGLEVLEPHRELMIRLSSVIINPRSPLSPFGPQTHEIRRSALESVMVVLEGHDQGIHADLRPHLPRLFWLAWMGVLVYWTHDDSEGQRRTRALVNKVVPMAVQVLGLLSLPMVEPLRTGLLEVLRLGQP